MHKTPQRGQSDEQEILISRPRDSYQQHKQRIATAKRQHKVWHSDEHPEVPKVRRASLQNDADRTMTRPADVTVHPTKKPRPVRPTSSATRSGQTRSNRPETPPAAEPRPTRKAQPRYIVEDYHDQAYNDYTIDDPLPRTPEPRIATHSRQPVPVYKRPTTVYEPPSTSHYRPHHATNQGRPTHTNRLNRTSKQAYSPLLARLYDLSHNRTILVTSLTILLALILLPLAMNSIISYLNHSSSTITIMDPRTWGGNTGNNSASSKQQSGNNSHQLVIVPPNNGHPAPPVLAASAYLMDADTGTTLYASNPFEHLPMLSTTKLMTALLAAEHGNPDQSVTITNAIANDINQLSADSSIMGIKKGETYTLRELLYGMFLVSGNDAAIAVADSVSGNEPAFVAKMNQRAAQLGMHDTHYMNPHGLLEPGHYSSAHDLAVIGRVSLSIPLLHTISATHEYQIPATRQHAAHDLFNGNQFLWWYPGADGGKPGWDGDTNFIQVVSCVRNNHHLIGVTMHTVDWWTDMRDLMNWGFSTFQWISPADVDAVSPIPYDSDWNYFAKDKKDRTIPTSDHGRYYIYTGFSVSGMIMTYFDKSGGLKKFGYPVGLPQPANTNILSQRFEKATIQCEPASKQCKTL
jgi:D-alanyl-D-alanine carboxypeptidase